MTILVLSFVLLTAGCVNHILTQQGDSPKSQKEALDDIIVTPDGLAYRANIYHEQRENPWPPISITSIEINNDT